MNDEVDSGESMTLAAHGICAIDLDGIPVVDTTGSVGPKDNIINDIAAFTMEEDTRQIGDIGLVYSTNSYQRDDTNPGEMRLNAEDGSVLPINYNRILEVA